MSADGGESLEACEVNREAMAFRREKREARKRGALF